MSLGILNASDKDYLTTTLARNMVTVWKSPLRLEYKFLDYKKPTGDPECIQTDTFTLKLETSSHNFLLYNHRAIEKLYIDCCTTLIKYSDEYLRSTYLDFAVLF